MKKNSWITNVLFEIFKPRFSAFFYFLIGFVYILWLHEQISFLLSLLVVIVFSVLDALVYFLVMRKRIAEKFQDVIDSIV